MLLPVVTTLPKGCHELCMPVVVCLLGLRNILIYNIYILDIHGSYAMLIDFKL